MLYFNMGYSYKGVIMAIDKITKDITKVLASKINQSLLDVKYAYGLDITLGEIKFNDVSFEVTLHGVLNSKEAVARIENERKTHWDKNCEAVGLTKEMYGKHFWLDGTEYKVLNLDLENAVNPVIVEAVKDKNTYTCSPQLITSVLNTADIHEETC